MPRAAEKGKNSTRASRSKQIKSVIVKPAAAKGTDEKKKELDAYDKLVEKLNDKKESRKQITRWEINSSQK